MLTEAQLKSIIKEADPVRGIGDKDGLFFSLTKSGYASFKFRYQINGRRAIITIGPYPALSLKEARQKAVALRHQLANNIDQLWKSEELNIKQDRL
ncbi:hypothetical protein KUC3_39330 [Alteromonas sp. KC3]|uniref:Arm DNA-binding domain-containing protein n=1 Tax=unclassified Alteromonas TaxID=2614992 RepID=UPI0019211452|nr:MULTISPECIES: Arm DNA-binding domain-containing protein [unclassified Alteromonas]BCO21076.1 hypothetical protein KUC3_39330 [Alteromonas sp. KC3]BCO25046.1 hypothetical protein KUC14_39150 [Alteromonas sp. KC14]